jgi:hypothetical protein
MSRVLALQVLYEFCINKASLTANPLENLILIGINEQHVLRSTLFMSIGLLKTGNALFRAMRPLLFLVNAEGLYGFSEILMRELDRTVIRNRWKGFSEFIL